MGKQKPLKVFQKGNEVDGTGAYYTEWSKSKRKTPIQYINTYMEFRNMVMMALYTRQQKRHRYKDRLLDSVGEGAGGMIWESSIETCVLPYVK